MSTQRKLAMHLASAAAAATFFVAAAPAVQAASNSEQIVFSGIGLPPASSEPFGIWVWCQNEQASPQSHYETDCNGAISFFARGVTKHVTGEVSEPEEGQYVMALVSDDGSVACMASNVPPIKGGPHNTVTADCTVNGASVTGLVIPNAVVNATGP